MSDYDYDQLQDLQERAEDAERRARAAEAALADVQQTTADAMAIRKERDLDAQAVADLEAIPDYIQDPVRGWILNPKFNEQVADAIRPTGRRLVDGMNGRAW